MNEHFKVMYDEAIQARIKGDWDTYHTLFDLLMDAIQDEINRGK